MTDQTPRTDAGRALSKPDPKAPPYNRMSFHHQTCDLWGMGDVCTCGLADEVLAIEAEARAEALDVEVLARAIEATTPHPADVHHMAVDWRTDLERAADIAREYRAILSETERLPEIDELEVPSGGPA